MKRRRIGSTALEVTEFGFGGAGAGDIPHAANSESWHTQTRLRRVHVHITPPE